MLRNKLPEVRAAATDRFRMFFIEGRRDIFQEYTRRDWGLILYQWATDFMVYERNPNPSLESYIVSLIDSQPEYVGRVLDAFISRTNALYDGLFICLRPELILDLLSKYGDAAVTSEAMQEAATLLRSHIAETNQSLKP